MESVTMTYEQAKERVAEIDAEAKHMDEMQYRYGIVIDRIRYAKLFQEKQNLKKQFGLRMRDKF